MPSTRETAMAALATTLLASGAEVWRGSDLRRSIPTTGLIEIDEGEAIETPMLSPLAYDVEQQAEILVAVTADDEYARDTAMDTLLTSIHSLVVADRTLAGAVDFVELGSATFEAREIDGAAKVARIPCVLSFHVAASPLG